MNTTNNTQDETLSVIASMRSQEDEVATCYNYLQRSTNHTIDDSCRTSMITWCQQVQRALKLSPETVWIATSFFDRYLSSGKGKSNAALQDKYKFQLAAITSFYISVKLYEDVELSISTLAKLCKGYYKDNDIIECEEDILFALNFRLATPTAMDFVQHYLKLLPSEMNTSSVIKDVETRVYSTCTDIYYTFCKPSVVAAACLTVVLTSKDLLTSKQREAFYFHLANITDIIDIMEVQNKLMTGHTKPVSVSKLTKSQPLSSISSNASSSPSTTTKKSSIISKVMKHQKKMAAPSSPPANRGVVSKDGSGSMKHHQMILATTAPIPPSPVCIQQHPCAA
jgi:hypothetical protein